MDSSDTILSLAALAQPTRLDAFRHLVQREPEGIAAGDLAGLLGVPQNTLSAHLGVLARAGLVHSKRQGRSIIYRSDLSRLRETVMFLLKDCCHGRPDVCAPIMADLAPCCPAGDQTR